VKKYVYKTAASLPKKKFARSKVSLAAAGGDKSM
jgi:hypothetical protein